MDPNDNAAPVELPFHLPCQLPEGSVSLEELWKNTMGTEFDKLVLLFQQIPKKNQNQTIEILRKNFIVQESEPKENTSTSKLTTVNTSTLKIDIFNSIISKLEYSIRKQFPKSMREAITVRNRAQRIFKKTQLPEHKDIFHKERRHVKELIKDFNKCQIPESTVLSEEPIVNNPTLKSKESTAVEPVINNYTQTKSKPNENTSTFVSNMTYDVNTIHLGELNKDWKMRPIHKIEPEERTALERYNKNHTQKKSKSQENTSTFVPNVSYDVNSVHVRELFKDYRTRPIHKTTGFSEESIVNKCTLEPKERTVVESINNNHTQKKSKPQENTSTFVPNVSHDVNTIHVGELFKDFRTRPVFKAAGFAEKPIVDNCALEPQESTAVKPIINKHTQTKLKSENTSNFVCNVISDVNTYKDTISLQPSRLVSSEERVVNNFTPRKSEESIEGEPKINSSIRQVSEPEEPTLLSGQYTISTPQTNISARKKAREALLQRYYEQNQWTD